MLNQLRGATNTDKSQLKLQYINEDKLEPYLLENKIIKINYYKSN